MASVMDMLKGRRSSRADNGPHWASKCKLEFSKEFEQKGIPLQDNPAEKAAKDLQQLASFFSMEGAEIESRLHSNMTFAAAAFVSTLSSNTSAPISAEAAALKAKSVLWKKIHARRLKLAQNASTVENAEEPEPAKPSPPPSLPPVVEKVPTLNIIVPARPPSLQGRPEQQRTRGDSNSGVVASMPAADIDMVPCQTSVSFLKAAHERIHRPVTPRDLLAARPPQALNISDVPPIFQRNRDRPQESHYNYFSRRIPEERPELRKVMEHRATSARRIYDGRERGLPAVDGHQLGFMHTVTVPCSPASSSTTPRRLRRGRFSSEEPATAEELL